MKNVLLIVGGIFFITACSTSKFDYNTAYKFSHYKYQKSELAPVEPLASIGPVQPNLSQVPSDKAIRDLARSPDATTAFLESYQNASKQEKKAIRQQVKEQYKSLRKEVKEAKKEATTKDVHFNQKMYIGLVVFGAGILIAILASGAVGAVAIIVGIGLIAWGFIEQA
jgi:ElaB/YqjD/DUF883 family membrane-anchored ribosome-binding protein